MLKLKEWEIFPLFTCEKGEKRVANQKIETKVQNLIEPIIQDLGYELYDVQYIKEGKDYYLRITIDKIGGICIEDCEKVNNAIDNLLDEEDLIGTSYFLEVSSPGIERVLRKPWHFEKQIGNEINLKLFKPFKGQKEFQGILKSYSELALELQIDEQIWKIENKNVAIAKTVANLF